MQLSFFSSQPYDRRFFEARRSASTCDDEVVFTFLSAELDRQTVALAEGADAICVFVNDKLDRDILTQLAALGVRAVLLRCAGYNHLDLEAADELGLFVARVPAYSPEAVAEHALALTMTLNRRTHRAYNRVREGNFMLDGLLGMTLHGKTVGIVGTGRIGRATAAIFHGMGCRVLGFDPAPAADFERLGTVVDMDRLLAESDVVSLHCPLFDSTHHLIDERALARMKSGAMLVNTSRGALIDTVAVIEALKSRRLGALAIDVYEQEAPLFFADRSDEFIDDDVFVRLMSFPNVLITGHQGFFTAEAMNEIADTTLANLADFLAGRVCSNRLSGAD
ncbi:2-hydroxyacid dehydrogenase [Salinisphaera sp. Q1T1-3]|uniref:2-hydroxyacid dehydrogenase n=1 Tax=Salinisphaera sp. Q1T1-3 TaxID=2321229 RepID=UPI000E75E197|nr:2-hydroxyacid dehydrogenase [Salinisphaera sp. Q1T1-3]RJS91996.1 2-hydroxyacid dehydrogenase [Salinisphaera sp. Q1T1-3]